MATTQMILDILQNFHGIEPLKELFCVELNYDRDNTPINNLPERTADLVAEAPLCVATGGRDNNFHIIYVKLKTEKLRKTDERQIITHLQTRYPDVLYIFSNPTQDHWHFVNVKVVRSERTQKLLFRRITIASDERLRTAAERIAMLDLEDMGEPDTLFQNRELLTTLEIRVGHEQAFNVEKVTEAFFEDYKRVFEKLQTELYNQTSDSKWAHDYAQQFLSRCLFLYFVQRKRWLGDDIEFLHTFWETYQNESQPVNTFVQKWLNVLFFEAFNNRPCNGYRYLPSKIREILQLAPYLNGGLFRKNALDTGYITHIADDLWQEIFTFFEKYNFTIAEDTPLDQEVAVDPEMIGKVYESLVSVEDEERGDAGIFYTPRVEIDLMCRLALVDNLANHIGTQDDKYLFYEALFAFEPDEKIEADAKIANANLWETVRKHLTEITVLDPACGSGSFLVGMLYVLDDLRERAEKHLGIHTASSFERRKALIGKNLYGVDVKQWACKVAELRLWLALITDADIPQPELHIRREPLLPNFSFNIRHGDSIVQDIGGMNLAQTRTISSGIPRDMQRKIKSHQTEKHKFYNSTEDREYEEESDLEAAEQGLFRELLQSYDTRLSKDIRATEAWLEDPSEQLTLDGITPPEPQQLSIETQRKQQELQRYKENQEQVRRARAALSSETTSPFVWDIAFVEIFRQRGGFDIVIENPPYIKQQRISNPTIPRSEVTKANKKAYKAKLARSIYQAFPTFFGYQEHKDTEPQNPESAVKNVIDAQSDYYIYFYFHGLSLLNSNGTFCAVTSNSWLDAAYGRNLKEFLLKKCHHKLTLDNSVQRSFKDRDVNTVICLTSAPLKYNAGLKQTSRFVNFNVPFETILHPVIFFEIETATKNISTPEHYIRPFEQKVILTNGIGETANYIGEKWGARYLRSPDVYLHILERGKNTMVRLDDVAKVRRGLITGADRFFAPDNSTISDWNIEDKFLSPVITDSEDVKSLIIFPDQLPHQIFLCSKDKNFLTGTSALTYIEWGESQDLHQGGNARRRTPWYNLGNRQPSNLCFPLLTRSTTAKTVYSPTGFHSVGNFIEVNVSTNLRTPTCFALNSTFFQLMVNVNGRLNRTWNLEIQPNDLKNLLCVDPNLIINAERNIDQTILESEDWDVLNPSPARRYIDDIVFDILNLTQGERDGVYEAVTQLVTTRLEKAKT